MVSQSTAANQPLRLFARIIAIPIFHKSCRPGSRRFFRLVSAHVNRGRGERIRIEFRFERGPRRRANVPRIFIARFHADSCLTYPPVPAIRIQKIFVSTCADSAISFLRILLFFPTFFFFFLFFVLWILTICEPRKSEKFDFSFFFSLLNSKRQVKYDA